MQEIRMQEILDHAEAIIMEWDGLGMEVSHCTDYVTAVEEVLNMSAVLPASVRDRAHRILKVYMTRFKQEFACMIIRSSEAVDHDWIKQDEDFFPTNTSDGSDDYDDDQDEDIPIAYPVTEFNVTYDPIPAERVKDLNVVAGLMVKAGRGKDCCDVYVKIRKIVLEQSLYRIGLERLNFDCIEKMPWEVLDLKIKKWIQALEVAVKVIFVSEKQLCDKVFHGLQQCEETCFFKLAMEAIMHFLIFAEAVAMVPCSPEKLFRVLDMYETVELLSPQIKLVFGGQSWEFVQSEVARISAKLADTATKTLHRFENAIWRDESKLLVPGGGLHPLTCYVMNYVELFLDYANCLGQLLQNERRGAPVVEEFGLDASSTEASTCAAPVAGQVMRLIAHLESNLHEKSKLYKNAGLDFLFLMNNFNYIVQNVKQSELASLLADNWLEGHSLEVYIFATNYVRTSWRGVFMCLRVEGLICKGDLETAALRIGFKQRLKYFNCAFEAAWKTQTSWVVPDPWLRDKLRIDIAGKLVIAYHDFINRYGHFIESK